MQPPLSDVIEQDKVGRQVKYGQKMWDVINGRSLGFHTYISRGKKKSTNLANVLVIFLKYKIMHRIQNLCLFLFSYFAGMSIGFLLNLVYCYENNPNNRKMVFSILVSKSENLVNILLLIHKLSLGYLKSNLLLRIILNDSDV